MARYIDSRYESDTGITTYFVYEERKGTYDKCIHVAYNKREAIKAANTKPTPYEEIKTVWRSDEPSVEPPEERSWWRRFMDWCSE